MSSYRFMYLSLVCFIAFIYGYIISIGMLAIMLGLGIDIAVSSVTALIVSTYTTLLIGDHIEYVADKVTTSLLKVKTFFRNKKEEFDAANFNRKNGLVLVS